MTPEEPTRHMTIKDLVRLSGYSLGTVSRVLNNQPNVSERARSTILAIAAEHGFELNTSAQSLKQQKPCCVKIRCSPRCSLIPECALQRRKSAWTVFLRRPFPPL